MPSRDQWIRICQRWRKVLFPHGKTFQKCYPFACMICANPSGSFVLCDDSCFPGNLRHMFHFNPSAPTFLILLLLALQLQHYPFPQTSCTDCSDMLLPGMSPLLTVFDNKTGGEYATLNLGPSLWPSLVLFIWLEIFARLKHVLPLRESWLLAHAQSFYRY